MSKLAESLVLEEKMENKFILTGALLLTFLGGFLVTELVFRLLFGRI